MEPDSLGQASDVVDFLAERALRDKRVRGIVDDARVFDELKSSPAWRRLYQKIEQDHDNYLAKLTKRLMNGRKVSDEELAYMRGFYTGALWLVSHPEHAEEALERAATHAWTLANVLGDDIEEGE